MPGGISDLIYFMGRLTSLRPLTRIYVAAFTIVLYLPIRLWLGNRDYFGLLSCVAVCVLLAAPPIERLALKWISRIRPPAE